MTSVPFGALLSTTYNFNQEAAVSLIDKELEM